MPTCWYCGEECSGDTTEGITVHFTQKPEQVPICDDVEKCEERRADNALNKKREQDYERYMDSLRDDY